MLELAAKGRVLRAPRGVDGAIVAHRIQRVHHPVGIAGSSAQVLDVDHAIAGRPLDQDLLLAGVEDVVDDQLGRPLGQRPEVLRQVRLGAVLVSVLVEQLRHERVAVPEQKPEAMVRELVGELKAMMQVSGSDAAVGADPEHDCSLRHPNAGGDQVFAGVDVEALAERHLEELVPGGDQLTPRAQRGAANKLDTPGLPDNGVGGVLAVDPFVEQWLGLSQVVAAVDPEWGRSRTQADSDSALLARKRSTAARIVGKD